MPDKKLVTPKYLTTAVAVQAVDFALFSVFGENRLLQYKMKRQHCHVVILVPAMEDARSTNYPDWPDYPTQPFPLYQHGLGKKSEWEHPFDEIAMCKALQEWTGRNDEKHGVIPHLLFPGDTPYWGAVKRHGIVVACSGVQPYFDRLIAGIVADTLIALAHEAWENDPDRQNVDFLK